MRLIYSNHARYRAEERGIKKLPETLQGAKVEYSVDGHKTVYSWPNGLRLAVITNELWVKTCWMVEKKVA